MNWMQRIMVGRYGMDQLNQALLGLYLLLSLPALFLNLHLLQLAAELVLLVVLLRMFSRQIGKRQSENARFLRQVGPMVRRYNVHRCRRRDKEHRYFRCPNCGQQLRVPRGKGKLLITCRSCGASFEKKT